MSGATRNFYSVRATQTTFLQPLGCREPGLKRRRGKDDELLLKIKNFNGILIKEKFNASSFRSFLSLSSPPCFISALHCGPKARGREEEGEGKGHRKVCLRQTIQTHCMPQPGPVNSAFNAATVNTVNVLIQRAFFFFVEFTYLTKIKLRVLHTLSLSLSHSFFLSHTPSYICHLTRVTGCRESFEFL